MHVRPTVTPNPWDFVKKYTSARIALGHASGSLPTTELLRFQADHAGARDAVHSVAEFRRIHKDILRELGIDGTFVQSQARNREEYLTRPDLGRKLHHPSREKLLEYKSYSDIVFVIGDGLSATAINLHSVSLLQEAISLTKNANLTAHIVLAKEARVALGDEIGEILESSVVVILIGERPGLSNTESIGAYITYAPRVGHTDAERNCISNICPGGLPLKTAAEQIMQLILSALKHQVTGIELNNKSALLPKSQ